MMSHYRNIGVTLAAATVIFSAGTASAQTLRVSGSATVSDSLMVPHKAEIEFSAGLAIEVQSSGSGDGIRALIDGAAEIAMISAPLPDVVRSLNETSPGSVDANGLVAHEIGIDHVAFVIHPTNPVRSLTSAQLYDILSGRITDWSEVGGLRMPIRLLVEAPGSGVRSAVESHMAARGTALAAETFVPYAPMVVRAVSENVDMLGIASLANVNASVDPLSTDADMVLHLFLVTRGAPDREAGAVIEAARSFWQRQNGGHS